MLSHSPRAPRRLALGSTCLLALPAALALSGPAAAQSVISTDQTNGVNLASYGAGLVSNGQGVSISSSGQAAVSASAAAQFANAGRVTAMNGTGIDLAAGGSVANSGAVNAGSYGVRVNNAAGQVDNTGAIGAGYDGISLNKGGSVTNSGSIFGAHIGVYTGNALGDVTNTGKISAQSGDAVSLYSGGSLTNAAGAELSGGYAGVYAGGNGSHISNAGIIGGGQFGVYLMGASAVSNSGSITGGTDGVNDLNQGGQVTNTGVIRGGQIGVKLAAHGAVDNSGNITGGTTGVKLGTNSTLANEASGHIAGGTTAVVAAAGDVLRNAGLISGQTGIAASGAVSIENSGVISATLPGGNAISLQNGASIVTLDTGSEIDGNIAANGTASQVVLNGSGMLSANLTGFAAGSAVTVSQGAVWTGAGSWQVARLVNNGVFTPGSLGAPLSLSGNFEQTATGTLRVLVTPAGMSPFAISGSATLGGTLRYVLAPGTYAPGDHTFLTAAGGISGSFDQVTSSQTGLSATPLHFGQGAVIAVSSTTTAPATATADADASVSATGAPAVAPVASVGAATPAAAALSFAAPVVVAPAGAPLFADTTQAMALGAFAASQAVLGHAAGSQTGQCEMPSAAGTGQAAAMATAVASALCAAGGWMQVSGNIGRAIDAYSLSGGGFLAGLDHGNGLGGRVGFAVGYDSETLSDDAGGTAGLQTIRLGLYASQPLGRFVLSGDVMGGIVSRNTTRYTGAAAATGKGQGHTISGDVQLALPLSYDGATITPAFGVNIASVTAGALNEASATSAFALNVAAASGTTVAPYLRLDVTKTFITASNLVITPDVSLGVSAMLNNPGANTTLTTQDGTAFMTHPEHMAPVSGQFSAGVSVSRGAWSLSLRYSAAAGGNWSGQSLQAGVQARF
jgi:hypothetical protein